MKRIVPLLLASALITTPAVAQKSFSWHGKLAADKTIEIKGVNGSISAQGTAGNEVVVTASKSGRKSDPDEVEIRVVEHDDGVTICAVYPTPRGRAANDCVPGRGGHNDTRDNDVEVDFEVQVPANVHFAGRSVNGEVRGDGLGSDAEAYTVNGNVRLDTKGVAVAGTVNGSIVVSMGRADWKGDLDFDTVNGSVSLTMPANLNADLEVQTVNGDIDSDFPIMVSGKMNPRSLKGRLGQGGRGLDIKTVNGSIRLRQSR